MAVPAAPWPEGSWPGRTGRTRLAPPQLEMGVAPQRAEPLVLSLVLSQVEVLATLVSPREPNHSPVHN